MNTNFSFDINDPRNYIFLAPKGKKRAFVDYISNLRPNADEPVKILTARKNNSFQFYFLRLPTDFYEIEEELNKLQDDYLRSLYL